MSAHELEQHPDKSWTLSEFREQAYPEGEPAETTTDTDAGKPELIRHLSRAERMAAGANKAESSVEDFDLLGMLGDQPEEPTD